MIPLELCHAKFILIFIATGYLLGSIPFGLILTKICGYGNIRKLGSGNIGATNVLRNSNKVLAALTLILDGTKGIFAILLARLFCQDYLVDLYVGVASVIGHIFPIWLQFRGGKGVATALGVFLLWNWHLGLMSCAIWLFSYTIARVSAVAAIVSFIMTPVLSYSSTHDIRLVFAVSFLCILVVIRHYDNIKYALKKRS